jgi:2-polyprenyl-3-methyl-5-hydroxy-6-metoxy-1,4-benzoquinol methylase
MENAPCNLCGASDAAPIYHLHDYRFNKPETTTQFVKCGQCGLVYQNPRPTIDEMSAHYPDEYEPYHTGNRQPQDARLASATVSYGTAKRCRFVTRFHPQGGRLLEVGCAAGQFLRAMKLIPGWSVQGVEINPGIAQTAREQYGLDIITGALEQTNFPDDTFDVVVLWDVLEHLHNPQQGLQKIGRILKPGGSLVLRVPNLDSWDARLFGKYWSGLDAPRHLYVFSRATLVTLLQKNKFEIITQSCRLGTYPAFVISLQFWLTGRGISKATRSRFDHLMQSPLAVLLAAPIFFISSILKKGSELTVVAQNVRQE